MSNFPFCHTIFNYYSIINTSSIEHYIVFINQRHFLMPLLQTFKHIEQFLFLSQCFQPFFSNYTYNYRSFPYFSVNILKVVCCRLAVCGKGLNGFKVVCCIFVVCWKGLNTKNIESIIKHCKYSCYHSFPMGCYEIKTVNCMK